MPTRYSTNFPRLKSDDEFEDLILDLCRLEWNDPYVADRHGRSGQRQKGVDIFGHPSENPLLINGAQCKLKTGDRQPTEAEIEKEVNSAREFSPPLNQLIITTDAPRDANTQRIVSQIDQRELRAGGFSVSIWFWDSICQRIGAYPRLIVKYFHDYLSNLTTAPESERLVDVPLRMLIIGVETKSKRPLLEVALELRGIQVRDSQEISGIENLLVDGLLFLYQLEDISGLSRFAGRVLNHKSFTCPTFVVLPGNLHHQFLKIIEELGGEIQKVKLLDAHQAVNETAKFISEKVFGYGYRRRGSLTTIDLSIRSALTRPRYAFLDINWESYLSPPHFPNQEEWSSILKPALDDVRRQVMELGDSCLIQFRSVLQLPAAFALGFAFNIRLSRLAVWARETGISDFRQQYWASDTTASHLNLSQEWIVPLKSRARSLAVELTNGRDIHASVETYFNQVGFMPDAWLQIGRENSDTRFSKMDQDCAVAFVDQVGQIIRNVRQSGITDLHIFLAMPSALAILVGQRLQACGCIHLYWYTNPSYQYAFTLQ
ncbi:MAG: SAVED domain-containing protein [Chloroflexi bacterium]|nr:SAVED domain-containing protein [Chloroflexota bacterium]